MATTEIHVEVDLLPQVIRELLDFTSNVDDVQVTDGPNGKMLLVESGVAERWFESRPWHQTEFADQEEPVKRKRGRPRKITSATVGEDVL